MALVMRLLELFQGGTMRKYNFLFFFFFKVLFFGVLWFFLVFLGPLLRYMEVPRLGV